MTVVNRSSIVGPCVYCTVVNSRQARKTFLDTEKFFRVSRVSLTSLFRLFSIWQIAVFFTVVIDTNLSHCIKAWTATSNTNCAVLLIESVLEQHINGRRHQWMLSQLQQRLRARRSVFVRGFLFNTTENELTDVFQAFGSISKVFLTKSRVRFCALAF